MKQNELYDYEVLEEIIRDLWIIDIDCHYDKLEDILEGFLITYLEYELNYKKIGVIKYNNKPMIVFKWINFSTNYDVINPEIYDILYDIVKRLRKENYQEPSLDWLDENMRNKIKGGI